MSREKIFQMKVDGDFLQVGEFRLVLKSLMIRRERDGILDACDAHILEKNRHGLWSSERSRDFWLSDDNVNAAKKWFCNCLGL